MSEAGLTPEEADVFARGLYHLANVDGIDDSEAKLIKEFLTESGASLKYEDLSATAFSPLEAAQTLDATYLRHIFLKTAMVLVHADGTFSAKERHALGEVADLLGLSVAEFADLEHAAQSQSFD